MSTKDKRNNFLGRFMNLLIKKEVPEKNRRYYEHYLQCWGVFLREELKKTRISNSLLKKGREVELKAPQLGEEGATADVFRAYMSVLGGKLKKTGAESDRVRVRLRLEMLQTLEAVRWAHGELLLENWVGEFDWSRAEE